MTRPTNEQAIQYVRDHFATHDYGFVPASFAAVISPAEPTAINVFFDDGRAHIDGVAIFTVWFEDTGDGPFLYGEW